MRRAAPPGQPASRWPPAGGAVPNRQLDAAVPQPNQAPSHVGRGPVEKRRILTGNRGFAIEHVDDAGRETVLEQRDQLMSDAVARHGQSAFDRSSRNSMCRSSRNVRICAREATMNGRTTRPARGCMPPRTRAPRAPEQTQQEGLRLVVSGVRDGNGLRVQPCGRADEERITLVVRRVLDRHAGCPRQPCDVCAFDVDRQRHGGREAPAERLVVV